MINLQHIEELATLMAEKDVSLKHRFNSMANHETVVNKSEKYAGYTLPNVFPVEGSSDLDEFQNDYQSIGATCVTNLANKMVLALFQPTRPFFKLELTKQQREEVLGETNLDDAQLDEGLANSERNAMKMLESRYARPAFYTAMKQLIITGNSLLYMPNSPAKKFKVYSVRNYAVERDLEGNVATLIVKESKLLRNLPDELVSLVREQNKGAEETSEIEIYTGVQCIYVNGVKKYIEWQELDDKCFCHKQIGIYNEGDSPWLPLTWDLVEGNHYGTGLVENYAGDFASLSGLAEAAVDLAAISTFSCLMVDPTSMTKADDITQARSGDAILGREEDVSVVTFADGIANSSQFLSHQMETIERRLGAAFLVNTLVTRDAERVTATEIRQQAHELDKSLGGVYSRLAVDLQVPVANRLLADMGGVFKQLEPTIVTGLDSLSRTGELETFRYFMDDLLQLAQGSPQLAEEVAMRLDVNGIISTLGAGHGIEYQKFLKTDEQVKAELQAKQAMQAQQVGMDEQAKVNAQG